MALGRWGGGNLGPVSVGWPAGRVARLECECPLVSVGQSWGSAVLSGYVSVRLPFGQAAASSHLRIFASPHLPNLPSWELTCPPLTKERPVNHIDPIRSVQRRRTGARGLVAGPSTRRCWCTISSTHRFGWQSRCRWRDRGIIAIRGGIARRDGAAVASLTGSTRRK